MYFKCFKLSLPFVSLGMLSFDLYPSRNKHLKVKPRSVSLVADLKEITKINN